MVPDPENIELNCLQIAWQKNGNGIVLGRQRINLDDQRWVGSVGWRQNEQTFDAVRGTALLEGRALFHNEQLALANLDFGALDASAGFVEYLQSFEWLRDLAAAHDSTPQEAA